ncbi:transglutaminase TgpA family protein [Tengunoibacter tsumagoiensis]|uniref:Transglutaminase-like domain-containing protein n=1 Tax=Tengunoibacter tsumagoiensis TaxID=2014871 RepID=A0A402A4J7_9CHLR|nr:transglutaminase domain-containing protein [Tengunoibacter tsumagoiensis]GCE14032.1 hypothetical protein KTT_38910 [Tengunoibacter tsumagoiensis]
MGQGLADIQKGVQRKKRKGLSQSDLPSFDATLQAPSKTSSKRAVQGWIWRPAEGWLVFFLLGIALYSVAFAIIDANWVPQSLIILWCPILGLLVGLGIAKLPYIPQLLLHLIASLIGYWFALWLTSVVAFQIPWSQLFQQLFAAMTGQTMPGLIDSRMIFFFYLSFLSFFLGYFGSWLIYRAHLPWLVVLVYAAIMLVNMNYITAGDYSYLVIIMLVALGLLVARMQIASQIMQWRRDGLYTDQLWVRAIVRRCMQIACFIVLITTLCGWLLPMPSQSAQGARLWSQMGADWNNLFSGNVSWQNFSFLPGRSDTTNFFGDQLTITGSVHLPTGEVLTYTSSDNSSHSLEGFTYNQFDGHTWTATSAIAHAYDANTDLFNDTLEGRSVTTTVKILQPPGGTRSYIFAPAHPTVFAVATIIYGDSIADTAWTQRDPLQKGESYQVRSSLAPTSAATFADVPLPANNVNYWQTTYEQPELAALQSLYLSIPKDLSPKVLQTAENWTKGATTSYEALTLLESHLNDENVFHYSIDNPPVPENMDVADWLLRNHIGYCTHYATTMAMMGRLLNIPMRMVNGFSGGHFDWQTNTWVVNGNDAHSWVQAFLPGHGWINFDPTPGFSAAPQAATAPAVAPTAAPVKSTPTPVQPTPTQKSTTPSTPAASPGGQRIEANSTVESLPEWWLWLSISGFIGAALFFFYALFRRWWLDFGGQSTIIASIFWRFCSLASLSGLAPQRWQTPYEYTGMLSRYLPQQEQALWQVTELFVRERWGQRQDHQAEVVAKRLWPRLFRLLPHLFWRRKPSSPMEPLFKGEE